MSAYGTEFFSMNDVNRLRILQDVIDRRLTSHLAASRLDISDRHCRCLLERYREHGPLSLVNRRRSKPGNRQLMPGLAERALRIIRKRYADFGPTLACEKLAEIHGLYLAKETDGTQANDIGWFMDPSQVTSTACTSATSAACLYRRVDSGTKPAHRPCHPLTARPHAERNSPDKTVQQQS